MFWCLPVHEFVFVCTRDTCIYCLYRKKNMYLQNHTMHHMRIKYELSRFQMAEHVGSFGHFFSGGSIHWRLHPVSWEPHLYQLLLHLLIVKCNLPNESAGCELQQFVLLHGKKTYDTAQSWRSLKENKKPFAVCMCGLRFLVIF